MLLNEQLSYSVRFAWSSLSFIRFVLKKYQFSTGKKRSEQNGSLLMLSSVAAASIASAYINPPLPAFNQSLFDLVYASNKRKLIVQIFNH